jgi:hypothetical protein
MNTTQVLSYLNSDRIPYITPRISEFVKHTKLVYLATHCRRRNSTSYNHGSAWVENQIYIQRNNKPRNLTHKVPCVGSSLLEHVSSAET